MIPEPSLPPDIPVFPPVSQYPPRRDMGVKRGPNPKLQEARRKKWETKWALLPPEEQERRKRNREKDRIKKERRRQAQRSFDQLFRGNRH